MSQSERIRLAVVVIVVTTMLSICVGIVITRAMPRVYAATALIQIKRETVTTDAFGGQVSRYDPYFLKTQFEIMRSTPVIEEVVRELNLNEVLGRAYGYYERMNAEASFERTVNLVKGKISMDIFRDTDLVAITVKLDRPNDKPGQAAMLAADIANQIARSFMSWDARKTKMAKEGGLVKLRQEMDVQDRLITEQEQKVADALEEHKATAMTDLEILKAHRGTIVGRINEERIRIELPKEATQIIQPAKLIGEAVPVSPNVALNIMLSILAGLIIGGIPAFFIVFWGIKINALFGKLSVGCLVASVVLPLGVRWVLMTSGHDQTGMWVVVVLLCWPFLGLMCATIGALKKESPKAYYIVGLIFNSILSLFVGGILIRIFCVLP